MMPKQAKSSPTPLHLCHPRAEIPGGSRQERERDFDKTMRRHQLHVVSCELGRARATHQAPTGLINRLRQIVDLLLGRGNVWVERRRH